MASFRKQNFGRRIHIEQAENGTSEQDQPTAHQFQFNIADAIGIDSQTTADIEGTPLDEDSQQQQALMSEQLVQLFRRASSSLHEEQTDEQEFFKRDASIKAPKTSKTIETTFPPDLLMRQEDIDIDIEQLQKLAKQKAEPLIIERYSPVEGQINHPLTAITLTFNQPMIAVSSLDEMVLADDLGISLTPAIEGRWRWTGTKTVQFEPQHRLPYSTKYTVTVNKARCISAIEGMSICLLSRSCLIFMVCNCITL
jgi:hypothetical protein